MFGRPKFGETDEDIIRLEQEYFKQRSENKLQISTKFVGVSKDEKKPVAQIVDDSNKNEKKKEISDKNVVVGKIVERKNDYDYMNTNIDTETEVKFKKGFPQVKRRAITLKQDSVLKSGGGSIFSQQRKKLCPTANTPQPMEIDTTPSTSISEFTSTQKLQEKIKNLPSKSYIVEGDEKDDIHKANISKLEEMSEQEIIEQQKQLINALDPEIVKFFKSKRKLNEDMLNVIQEKNEEKIPEFKEDIIEVDKIETAKEILEKAENKWLNFDKIETEKLQWMKNIDIPKKPKAGSQNYEARFDFEGWLLPYVTEDINEKNRILYHHGNEPGRPGYSLQELFKLCRSTVQQQRILALNTISNILSLHLTGVYENVIEIPIEQIFFVIRIAMDDNTPAVLNAGVKALHNIFYSRIDEVCLDSLLGFGTGFVQPILSVDNGENKEDEHEINDQQIAEMDLIKCLMRTDILIRIRYIINVVKPPLETITYCLELLIRLVRDSELILNHVYSCEELLGSIVKHFLPKIYQLNLTTSAYHFPSPTAIKLFRIIASRSRDIAEKINNQYKILDTIVSYISNDIATNLVGIKIQIESLNLLAVYLYYQLGTNQFREVLPFLIRNLEYHLNNTDLGEKSTYSKQNHFSALVNVITQAATIGLCDEIALSLLRLCMAKYCTQISKLTNFKCGHLQMISSLLICLQYRIESNVVNTELINVLKSEGFLRITDNIKAGSNLLCGYDSLKSSPNLQFCEAVVWNTSEHVVPILLTSSSLPFLRALTHFINSSCSDQTKLDFLQHQNILKYLHQLKKAPKYYLTTNWLTKIESQFIMTLLKVAVDVQSKLKEPMLYYEVAVKCLGIFGSELRNDVDYILKNIVFNKNFYPSEMLLREMDLGESPDVVKSSLKYIEEIYDCYSNIVGLKKVEPFENLSLDVKIGNIVPIDWIYSPIVLLYSNKDEKIAESDKELIITRCLQWIFLYETYFPVLSSFINSTDKFCRLCCVFLLSNSLFLEENVQKLLRCLLEILLSNEGYKKLNFDKEIQGLNNFQDFYTEFLEQYQGVSYGNEIFANFVLVPLMQKQNEKWRKTLWSEYMGVAQTIILTRDKVMVNTEEFFDPPETDISILKCYRRALITNSLSRNPFLKELAHFHVENFVKNKKKDSNNS